MAEIIKGLYNGKGIKDFRYVRYIVCKEMGWDYYTFENQPQFFIEEIMLIMHHESQREKSEMEKIKRGVK